MRLATWFLAVLFAVHSPGASRAQASATTTATTPTAAPASSAIPVDQFFRRPAIAAPELSPSGDRIAMLIAGSEDRTVLAVAEVSNPRRWVGVARFNDADVRSFRWVNNQRLVFDAIDFKSPAGEQFSRGLYAVNVDGSDFLWLVGRGYKQESESHLAVRPLRWNHVLRATVRDGSNDVIVERFNFRRLHEPGSTSMFRLDTTSRALKALVIDEPDGASGWVLDRSGVPRAALSIDKEGLAKVMWRGERDSAWSELARHSIWVPAAGSIEARAIDYDGQLLVTAASSSDEAGTAALYRYDVGARRIGSAPILALRGFDFMGELMFDPATRKLAGASYVSDAAGVAWFDPAMKALQDRVDILLPNTVNVFACGACSTQRHFVVTSGSDRQSPIYLLLDREKQGKESLTLIGASRPWMDAARMAEQDFVRVKARDGLEFPVYVTKPQGKGPWPTVVLVHGGPWVRGGSWGWDADAQFLASRGYLVVEPEFRGSIGYGHKLFRASWKQWGLTMQDDVTDATRWAIAQGLADPKRIAIAGASYGGYATLMGLVKEPELYRAGINWVGVTDIDLMYAVDWSDASDEWQRYGMPRLVGDRDKDKAQFDATSPLKRAAEITKPVLMAYGGEDYRVPLPHGTRMRDALKAAGKAEVEWVEYPDEGHGFLLLKNNVDFWQRVERFLAKHLK